MKKVKFFPLIVIILFLASCAGTSANWKGIKFGKHDSQAASKTHNYSLKWVDEATLKVLDQMEIMIIEDNPSPDGNFIRAATLDQDITIELKSVNSSSTHMKIDIKLTDHEDHPGTANEIIEQIHQYLLTNAEIAETDLAEGLDLNKDHFPAE